MLRRLVGRSGDMRAEQLDRIVGLIDQYCTMLRVKVQDGLPENEPIYRIEAWAGGFKDSLNELEQSQYMAHWFRKFVTKQTEEEMDEQELANYRSHVYFYKNAIVRVFSVLDKLGYFMNELLQLRTERVKPRYSFFTVLRQMRTAAHAQELYERLQRIKTEYKEPLNILRQKRNTEIHYVNVEMLDDILQTRSQFTTGSMIEDLDLNLSYMDQGCRMVYLSLESVFDICRDRIPAPKRRRR